MEKSLSPRDAADRLGITPDTLRRWEREGLIESERTPGGQRRYRETDVAAVLGNERPSRPRIMEQPLAAQREEAVDQDDPVTAPINRSEVPSWERRVREEEADLQVTKLRQERAALLRAEEAERRQLEDQQAAMKRRQQAERAETERQSKATTEERQRLEALRQYGRGLSVLAPPEYQTKVARDLAHSINSRDYPAEMGPYLLYTQIRIRVDELLKPWRDAQAREKAQLAATTKRGDLINTAFRYLTSKTVSWDSRDSRLVRRDVEAALDDELEIDWTYDDARALVDEVLDEWEDVDN